jgi:ABC-type uncharacterized transport system involved in gliding motility auxiliary subunit
MAVQKRIGKYSKFIVYLVVVVLINIVSMTLFQRADLTSNGLYSLSEASRNAVATLSEPLTINVFFTKNLPAPHNNTERYLHDLLEEYAVHSNKYFNYRFYDVSPEEGDISERAKENQEKAKNYGIYPVQIQNIEQDEVKFQKAYMGMVMIHGDVVDKIPAITTTEGLEYTITSKIEKMNSKISALLNLDDPIQIKLVFSSSFSQVASQLRMPGLLDLPQQMEEIVGRMNQKYYGKLSYTRIDPTADPLIMEQIYKYTLVTLRWPAVKDAAGAETIPAGRATAGIVVEKGETFSTIQLIQVIKLPIFGTQYQLANMEEMEERLGEVIDDVIDINKKIGYLSSHGTLSLSGPPQMPGQPPQQQPAENLANFNRLVSEDYSVAQVALGDEGVPEGIDCLIIANPKESFSDYDLFQIDQFLMRGKSLALFIDPFEEIIPQQSQMRMNPYQEPVYRPLNTGLEKLISHYGIEFKRAYILDKSCFEQQIPEMYGGGKRPFYFAPIIKNEHINKDLPFLQNIKALVMLKSSPVTLRGDALAARNLTGTELFSSSQESWEMSGRINLNPMTLSPPVTQDAFQSYPLAALVEGEFPSYFADREIPEKPAEEEPGEETEDMTAQVEEDRPDTEAFTGEGTVIKKGNPGKIFFIGTSEIIKNSIIDEEGGTPNATFVMNLFDYLNGRPEYAAMRGKMQRHNPLRDSSAGVKTFVKTFNIAGLPVLVAIFGIGVWAHRSTRKRKIQMMFGK